MINGDLPLLIQNGLWLRRFQINITIVRLESGINLSAPGFVKRDKFNRACAFAHIPEVRVTTLKFRLRPGKPDAVMMQMLWRIIIRDDAPRRRIDSAEIAAAL